jgi:hypothetical protein
VFLFERVQPTTSPRWSRFELTVGDATLELDPAEVRDLLSQVLRRAAGQDVTHAT